MMDSIERILQGAGLTKKKVGELSGIPAGRVCEYLNRNRIPGLANLRRLALALGLTTEELTAALYGDGIPQRVAPKRRGRKGS